MRQKSHAWIADADMHEPGAIRPTLGRRRSLGGSVDDEVPAADPLAHHADIPLLEHLRPADARRLATDGLIHLTGSGREAAFHKLAYAVHHRRSAALIHTQDVQALLKQAQGGRSFLTWMATQAIEAYATNGAYIPFHVELDLLGKLPMKKIWGRVFEHNRFVQEHMDLYQGELASGSPVAFLFLFNERGRTIPAVFPSYLGLAQGFVEGNYPFDVVFAGDGRYV